MQHDKLNLSGVGRALILIGVVAWFAMGLVWLATGEKPSVKPFLAWHLSGILPGVSLKLLAMRGNDRLSSKLPD